MDKILELQSEMYIKMKSINEPNKFQNTKTKKNSKKWKKLFNNTMKTILRVLNM